MGEAEGLERQETHRKNITEKKSMTLLFGNQAGKGGPGQAWKDWIQPNLPGLDDPVKS